MTQTPHNPHEHQHFSLVDYHQLTPDEVLAAHLRTAHDVNADARLHTREGMQNIHAEAHERGWFRIPATPLPPSPPVDRPSYLGQEDGAEETDVQLGQRRIRLDRIICALADVPFETWTMDEAIALRRVLRRIYDMHARRILQMVDEGGLAE